MKKNASFFLFPLMVAIVLFYPSVCFAVSTTYVRSGICKPIKSYTCDDYYDVIKTEDIENHIYNYYQERKLNLQITKRITSQAYIEQIREFILEDWTPPFYYTREEIAYKFDKVFDDLYIVQIVDFDFRRKFRNAIVMEESLWGVKGNSNPEIILHCAGDEILPGNRVVYDIDYDEEYGQIARDAVEFLESIKDIYFDEKVHAEYEQKEKNRQKSRKIKDYLKYWSGNLTQIYEVATKDYSFKLFMDLPSFHSLPTEHGPTPHVMYEGWLTMDTNPPLQMDTRNYLIQKSKIYCRIDYHGGIQYNLATIEFDNNGQEYWRVLEKPEQSLFENTPWADRLWKEIAQKYKLPAKSKSKK